MVSFGFQQFYLDLSHKIIPRHLSLQTNRSLAAAGIPPRKDHGLYPKKIRNALRINVADWKVGPINREVSQQRIANAFIKAFRNRSRVAGFRNVINLAASVFSHLVEQEAIRRTAQAHREYARI